MPYPLLDPSHLNAGLAAKCALAVMAKAPRAGRVKTRLSPPLTLEQSSALNTCFLRDIAKNIADVSATEGAAGIIAYTPLGDEALFDDLLPPGFSLIPQRGDGFGERLFAATQDILAAGYGAVCLIDSDSPTLPAQFLLAAVSALSAPGDRIVLGGTEDGGYYLIGLKAAHAAPFERITWSTASVFEETVERAREAAIEVVALPLWYDVDDGATLEVLRAELLRGTAPAVATAAGYDAEATRKYLRELDASGSATVIK